MNAALQFQKDSQDTQAKLNELTQQGLALEAEIGPLYKDVLTLQTALKAPIERYN